MSDYVWPAIAATCGVVARIGSWRRADATFDWWKAFSECMTIPSLTFIVAGAVEYVAPTLDVKVICLIAVFAGLMGVAGVQEFALKWFKKKAGIE